MVNFKRQLYPTATTHFKVKHTARSKRRWEHRSLGGVSAGILVCIFQEFRILLAFCTDTLQPLIIVITDSTYIAVSSPFHHRKHVKADGAAAFQGYN